MIYMTFYDSDTVPHKYIITNSYCYQNQSTFITACCVFAGGITGSTKLSATANPGNNYQMNLISYVSSFSGASANAVQNDTWQCVLQPGEARQPGS